MQNRHCDSPLLHTVALGLALGITGAICGLVPSLIPPVPALSPWAEGIAIVWLAWRADHCWQAWRRSWQWHHLLTWHTTAGRVLRTTPAPAFVLGKGFAWQPQYTATLLQYGVLPVTTDTRGGSPALHAVGIDQETHVFLPISELTAHMAIQGGTRSGKTQLLRLLVSNAIHKTQGAVVVIDPKGGGDLIAHTMVEAHQAGRPFKIICPHCPELSAAFDPLSTCSSALEVKERIRALMPGSREPFFTEKPLVAVHRTAAMMEALQEPWTLPALHAKSLRFDQRCALTARYLAWLGASIPDQDPYPPDLLRAAYTRLGKEDSLAASVLHDLDAPLQWYEQVTNNLDTALSGIVDTAYTKLIVERPALSWQEIDDQRMVVVILTASLLLGEGGMKLGRLMLQDFMGYIGQRYLLSSVSTNQPITLLVDETSEVVYEDFLRQVDKGGEAGAQFILAWQSQANLEAKLGLVKARELLDNLQSRVWLRIADTRTAEDISTGLGTCNISRIGDRRAVSGKGDETQTQTVKSQDSQSVPFIDHTWFPLLPQGEGFARLRGHLYKIRVPLLSPPDDTLVQRMGYGQMIRTIRQKQETINA